MKDKQPQPAEQSANEPEQWLTEDELEDALETANVSERLTLAECISDLLKEKFSYFPSEHIGKAAEERVYQSGYGRGFREGLHNSKCEVIELEKQLAAARATIKQAGQMMDDVINKAQDMEEEEIADTFMQIRSKLK